MPVVFKFVNKAIFRYAISFLSIFVIIIAMLNYHHTNIIIHIITVTVLMAIFINGVQHCVISLIYKKILPGTITAIILIIPFSLWVFLSEKILFSLGFFIYLVLGFVVMYIFIILSLSFGYVINKLFNK
jgi:hypothetical protein